MSKVEQIIEAKQQAGGDAFLWMHSSGDCILWPNEAASINDDGKNAIARWTLTLDEITELENSGKIDEAE